MRRAILLICVLLLAPPWCLASDAPVVAVVKTSQGQASVVRDGKAQPARLGFKLIEQDTLRTGGDGSVGVIFRDDSLLSLGPNSEVLVDEFLFQPTEDEMSLVTKMARGTASYVSGKIAEVAPEKVRFETPLSTIGIRGTHFVVKVEAPEDGK